MDQILANKSENRRWVLLGASSGLGKAFSEVLVKHCPLDEVLSMSRKLDGSDFAEESRWPEYAEKIKAFQPTHLIYFAAGGPYGPFEKFQWKDHHWSMKVSFLFPAYLLHNILRAISDGELKEFRQITLIGSEVAESKADPGAAAYCASKHALKGLVDTLRAERPSQAPVSPDASRAQQQPQILLFSPGYMETRLLPPNSWPRLQKLAVDPHLEALKLYDFVIKD